MQMVILLAFILVAGLVVHLMRQKAIRDAGGPDAYAAQQRRAYDRWWQERFQLADDETVGTPWVGQCYLGPLVQGSAPGVGTQLVAALANQAYVGALLQFAVTTRGRLVVAVQQEGRDYDALLRWDGAPRPRLLTAAEAFAGQNLPREVPQMRAAAGAPLEKLALAQFVFPDGRPPFTFWAHVATLGTLARWSQASAAP